MQLQENLKENPFGLRWQLETLYCTSQLHASQGQQFQGSRCSGAVGNGVFLAASDCPLPIPLAGCCWNGSGHFYVEGTMQRRPALLMLHGSVHLRPLHTTDWALLLYPQTLILPTHSSRPAAHSTTQKQSSSRRTWMTSPKKRPLNNMHPSRWKIKHLIFLECYTCFVIQKHGITESSHKNEIDMEYHGIFGQIN